MNLMHIAIAFIVGFIFGGFICYLTAVKLFFKHQLNDELTAARRELANSKRGLNDFYNEADAAFAKLDEAYRKFAQVLSNGAAKLNKTPDMFHLERNEVLDDISDDAINAKTGTAEQAAVLKAFRPLAQNDDDSQDPAKQVIKQAPTSVQAKVATETIIPVKNKENVLQAPKVKQEQAEATSAPASQATENKAATHPTAEAKSKEVSETAVLNQGADDFAEKQLTEPPKDFAEERPAPTKI
ncbi:MAG: YhcB family protein [Candidatus Anaerobiospirillum merdipullorum]|uniref:YhcB family protein n=1 Tax=Candidatus Anaerobiospirillum merdipullorum TaxID=2838450 RepID=A0A9E2KMF6_9GAMM|nr:YhcB family protein [Candidatus Anaerobiospirillum merdipullorum]